jgi:hypothetical protein
VFAVGPRSSARLYYSGVDVLNVLHSKFGRWVVVYGLRGRETWGERDEKGTKPVRGTEVDDHDDLPGRSTEGRGGGAEEGSEEG